MGDKKLYDENSIQSLTPLEFTRLRPGVYCGSTEYATQPMIEIVSNAVDEFKAGHGNTIEVKIDSNNVCSVRDYAQGFLINHYREDGKTILQAAFDTLNLSNDIKQKRLEYLKSNENELALEKLNKFSDSNKEEIIPWLETLNALNLINPKTGEIVQFPIDENKDPITLAKSANTLLKALKVDVENDSGDIGSSSKIFMQVGSWINSVTNKNDDLNKVLNKKGSGGSGITSIAMMGVLLFLSLLCELAINQFSPQPKLTRKLVGKFRRYFPKDFDINEFIFEVSKEKYKAMEIDTEEYDREIKICADIAIKSQATLKKIIEEKKKELANSQADIQEKKVEEKPIRKVRQINKEPQEEKSTEDALKNALEGLIKKVEQE